jgi:hypothetical protein
MTITDEIIDLAKIIKTHDDEEIIENHCNWYQDKLDLTTEEIEKAITLAGG